MIHETVIAAASPHEITVAATPLHHETVVATGSPDASGIFATVNAASPATAAAPPRPPASSGRCWCFILLLFNLLFMGS